MNLIIVCLCDLKQKGVLSIVCQMRAKKPGKSHMQLVEESEQSLSPDVVETR